jgi:hypothetical protein
MSTGEVVMNVNVDDVSVGINGSDRLYIKESGITSTHIADGTIINADIDPLANIAWNKVDKTGASFDDIYDGDPWRLFYSDGSGSISELPFGVAGKALVSTGSTSAPSWDSISATGSAGIDNQYAVTQAGNFRINGIGSAAILKADPAYPDTFSPTAGMIRTSGSGSTFRVFVHDGLCWRKLYPSADSTTCFGSSSFTVDVGPDQSICDGSSVNLTATAIGGWPPYVYDWVGDGTWDDPPSITVAPSIGVHTYTARVRDGMMTVMSDA